jgi:hypothetical protein
MQKYKKSLDSYLQKGAKKNNVTPGRVIIPGFE